MREALHLGEFNLEVDNRCGFDHGEGWVRAQQNSNVHDVLLVRQHDGSIPGPQEVVTTRHPQPCLGDLKPQVDEPADTSELKSALPQNHSPTEQET